MSLKKARRKGQQAAEESALPQHHFTSGSEIRQAFLDAKQSGSTELLTALRNQLTIRSAESNILPQDGRLLLVKEWLELSPNVQEVFALLERGTQNTMITVVISTIACLLTLLNSHHIYQPVGLPLIKMFLSPRWMRQLEAYLYGSHTELTLMSLKLLNIISVYAGGSEQKALFDTFTWDIKSINKLLFMRRKWGSIDKSNILAKPDIRTLCLQFILSFLSTSSLSHVKLGFLEQHRDVFMAMFKGLKSDPYLVVRMILEACWIDIWQDQKLKRTIKIGLFNETSLQSVIGLYGRGTPEGSDPEHIPADVAHHFLLAICTHRGVGVCFADRGWYPRDHDDLMEEDNVKEEGNDPQQSRGGKVYNKILANIVKTLNVNEDLRQQELAFKILASCPELVAGYWRAAALTMEPRLSSKWLVNIAFLGNIVALPVPRNSFLLPENSSRKMMLYEPAPPPLSIIMENLLPSVNIKNVFTKGLQSSSALVQHSTAIALVKCLMKCKDTLVVFKEVKTALEEEDTDGQWTVRIREIEGQILKWIPDLQVIIAFSQASYGFSGAPDEGSNRGRLIKSALVSEIAQRLMWLYHVIVPSLMWEVRFDTGKSLQSLVDDSANLTDGSAIVEKVEFDSVDRLARLRELHIFRTLRESDQFVWSKKSSTSTQSNLFTLMMKYTKTRLPALQDSLASLLSHALSDSHMFLHDTEELFYWLDSLPTIFRMPGAEAPDGAPLADEHLFMVKFLDDCMQRCNKTPYRYIDDMFALMPSRDENMGIDADFDVAPAMVVGSKQSISPLIMTVLEQFAAKLKGNILQPCDVLALATYMRKLVIKLVMKSDQVLILEAVASKIRSILSSNDYSSRYALMSVAIWKEVSALEFLLQRVKTVAPSAPSSLQCNATIQEFLRQADEIPKSTSEPISNKIHAYELVDWIRLIDHSLHPSETERVVLLIQKLHRDALPDFYSNLRPDSGSLWACLKQSARCRETLFCVPFDLLFLQATDHEMQSGICQDIMLEVLNMQIMSLRTIRGYLVLIFHRLKKLTSSDVAHTLRLLTRVFGSIETKLSQDSISSIKKFVFEHKTIRNLFSQMALPESVVIESDKLVLSLIMEEDRDLIRDICAHWAKLLEQTVAGKLEYPILRCIFWIKYMDSVELMRLTEQLLTTYLNGGFPGNLEEAASLFNELFFRLAKLPLSTIMTLLQRRFNDLIAIDRLLPDSDVYEKIISIAVSTCIPIGLRNASNADPTQLRVLISNSELYWSSRLHTLPEISDIAGLFERRVWTATFARIVADLLYKMPKIRTLFWNWLRDRDASVHLKIHCLVIPMVALFDSSTTDFLSSLCLMSEACSEKLLHYFRTVCNTLYNGKHPEGETRGLSECVILMWNRFPSLRIKFAPLLLKALKSLTVDMIHIETIRLGLSFIPKNGDESETVVQSIIDLSLQWSVRLLSGDSNLDEKDRELLQQLTKLIRRREYVTVHLAEPALVAAIQGHLTNEHALHFAGAIMEFIALKPVNVNRHLQSILQHPQLQYFSINSMRVYSDTRDALIQLIYTIFLKYPTNTCQPSHIVILTSLYSGTLSKADRCCLRIFQLFESQRRISIASLFSEWSASPNSMTHSSLDAIKSLDAAQILHTCLEYPMWRSIDAKADITIEWPREDKFYDPIFLLLLIAQTLMDAVPKSAMSWVELFRTNTVSLLIRMLSSRDGRLRQLVLLQITSLWTLLKTADLQEKDSVMYILNLLKDLIPRSTEEQPERLSSFATLVLAHALRSVFYPSNFIYPLTSRFLLQRPEVDPHDVPLLYGMLYSNSDDWKKERTWILRFLADGLSSSVDWRVFKRRHTWDILASMFQSTTKDRSLRHGILEVLASLSCNRQAITSLVLRSSLLHWIAAQMRTMRTDERTPWMMIFENIIITVDVEKIEKATNGVWRWLILKSLNILIDGADIDALFLASRIILRLAILPFEVPSNLLEVIARGTASLKAFEASFDILISSEGSLGSSKWDYDLPPHTSQRIHHSSSVEPLQAWGKVVENFWQASMICLRKVNTWDALSCRTLLWRSIVGEENSRVGEWVRREILSSSFEI